MKKRIAVLGSGAMGTAISKVLIDSGHDVIIYGIDKEELHLLARGFNSKYFPSSVKLPKFNVTNDMQKALKGASHIVIVTPSTVMDKVMPSIVEFAEEDSLLITGSKGFYPNSKKSLHEGISEFIKPVKKIRGVVSLIGPSHAEEIVLGAPTILSAVDNNKKLCKEVQDIFKNNYFKIYIQTDVRGAETGAAYKNVLAIASGMAAGLGYGINTTAALLTRGMAEMRKYNKVMKGKDVTLMGFTGFGDIIVTATSDLSRNYTLGKNIAKKGKKALETKITVEGVAALKIIKQIADENNLDLPIINFLYEVLFGKFEPKDFSKELWDRPLKEE